jgi:hypothetical protein
MSKRKRKTKITVKETFYCDDGDHAVASVSVDRKGPMVHRRKPCEQCPWRSDLLTGVFPADAFKRSTSTAKDMSTHTFACHMSGQEKPQVCAGFLLRGANHNLSVRMAMASGRYDPSAVSDGGFPLYDNYASMALANGVDEDDEDLKQCR